MPKYIVDTLVLPNWQLAARASDKLGRLRIGQRSEADLPSHFPFSLVSSLPTSTNQLLATVVPKERMRKYAHMYRRYSYVHKYLSGHPTRITTWLVSKATRELGSQGGRVASGSTCRGAPPAKPYKN